MIIEKTNTRLTLDVSTLNGQVAVLQGQFNTIDACGNYAVNLAYTDASLVARDTEINLRATNASVNTALTKAFATNASLGSNLRYNPMLGVGLRNASGNLYDFIYIDTSAYLKVGTTTWLQWNIKSTTLG